MGEGLQFSLLLKVSRKAVLTSIVWDFDFMVSVDWLAGISSQYNIILKPRPC